MPDRIARDMILTMPLSVELLSRETVSFPAGRRELTEFADQISTPIDDAIVASCLKPAASRRASEADRPVAKLIVGPPNSRDLKLMHRT